MAAPTHPFGQIKSKRKRRHPKLIVAPIPSLKLFLRQPKYSSSRLHSASFCDGSPFRSLSSSAHHTQHCLCGNVHPHDRGFAFAVRGIPNSIATDIAFVEMSIRMTADSHLPSVGYQIRLQRILNEWFVILMMLLLEGNAGVCDENLFGDRRIVYQGIGLDYSYISIWTQHVHRFGILSIQEECPEPTRLWIQYGKGKKEELVGGIRMLRK
ncbi:hypothetical protein IV203_028311 [Nitzschia inconspicua]|uniref:Uncharacterized protein n=1 Tax=Nitzschia inconspicua TaxID=303405 RepID=A0A9K3K8Y5_9STRA|nr:hypothetical protein IV203_028311 [Nitzschia inconspicua]